MNIDTEISGIPLSGCVFNASGPKCTSQEELDIIGKSKSAAIVTKSCTFEPREGNPKPRYVDIDYGSINSMGLPNLGYKEYLKLIQGLRQFNKPVIVSVSGLSLKDNIEMITAFNDSDVDLIELNLSCPNIIGKPQVGYDFEQTDAVLTEIMKVTKKPLGVKLPPYFDEVHFQEMSAILNKHKVKFVACINSVGNGLYIDAEKEQVVIKPKGGFGGIGGKYVKPTALANVRMFYELLDKEIDVIGVGGIESGQDVFEFILAGAKAVQIATVFMQEGEEVFARIQSELVNYMQGKGYTTLTDFRGKLKKIG